MRIIRLFFLFVLLVLTTPVWAACETPANLADYRVINGDYNLSFNSDSASPGIYVNGDVNISLFSSFTGNIYATGNIRVSWGSRVNGSVYAQGRTSSFLGAITGENCDFMPLPPPPSYCDTPPDVTGYTLYEGNLNIPKHATQPASGREDLYVTGSVTLNVHSHYNGNIYAVGDVYLNNNAVIHGDVYSQDGIILRNDNNSIIDGEICENVDPVALPLDLPVDELTPICSDIFKDAAQSYSSSGKLTMWGTTRIFDDTDSFDFSSYEGHSASCGSNTACSATGQQSTRLSDFDIPEIAGLESIDVASWGDGQYITLGDPNAANPKFRGSVYGAVTVYGNARLTFAPQPAGHVYRINRLNIYDNGVVRLNAGSYAFNGLGITGHNSKVTVLGDGDIYLFANKTDSIQGKVVNYGSGRLVLATKESMDINNNADFYGDIYVNGTLQLNGDARIKGRVAAANLTMNSNFRIRNNLECGIPPGNDYEFVINTASDALTCEPHPVAVQVLLDGNIASDYSGSINLATSSNIGTWSVLNGNGSLTDSGLNNGQASYQFSVADAGQVELGLFNETAEELSITVSSGAVDSNPAVVTFRPFLLQAEFKELTTYKTSNLPFALNLTAIGKDQTTGNCKIIEEYTGDQNLKFWSAYKEPVAPKGDVSVEVNGEIIEKNASAATNQTITFNNGLATVFVNYPDAGQIQIHARDDLGIGAPAVDPTEVDELKGSIITVVKPASLYIAVISGNPAEVTGYVAETGDKFKRASVPNYLVSPIDVDTFDLTVKAVIDCSVLPNKHCSDDPDILTVAPSFTSEITLTPSLIFPVSTSDAVGTLHYKQSLEETQTMQEGKFTYSDLAYDEVGVVGLKVKIDNYLGTGGMASDIKPVGRFYPDSLAFVPGSFNSSPVCTENYFAYIGEPDALAITYSMEAYSQASTGKTAKVTSNYDDDLDYPVADYFEHFAYASAADGTELSGYKDNSTLNRIFSDSAYNKELWSQGRYNFDLGNLQKFYLALKRTIDSSNEVVPDGPFTNENSNQVRYRIKVTGGDGEKLQVSSSEVCSDDRCEIGNLSDLVYGRLRANNGHGSEFQALRTKVEATYFDGVNFVPFSDDNCTAIIKDHTDMIKNPVALNTDLTVVNSPNSFVNGFGYFEFSAPETRGKLDYYIQLKNNSDSDLDIPWLLDSGNAVNCSGAPDCIKGYVEFGLFRGNDRIIYRRQSFD